MDGLRKGSWLQTATGGAFWPLDPRAEDVNIVDIAHALSMQCRYAGHSIRFYSVAEHCCYVSDYCSEPNKLWGLLHDAAEAYLVDLPRPIKRHVVGYADAECMVEAAVADKFGLAVPIPTEVYQLDNRILVNERDQIMARPPMDWGLSADPLPGLTIQGWSPQQARAEFLRRYIYLTTTTLDRQVLQAWTELVHGGVL